MSVLTVRKTPKIKSGGWYETHPVAASTSLLEGEEVMLNSSGLAISGADTASCTYAGVAMQSVDNSSGAAGDLSINVYFGPHQVLSAETETQAKVQTLAYISDNQTIADVGTVSNNVLVGLRTEFVDSGTCWVDPRRRSV